MTREGLPTTVAALRNDPVNAYTSFASEVAAIDPGKAVLFSGLLRSADGGGAIGYRWVKDGDSDGTQYLLSGEDTGLWRHVTRLLAPPDGVNGIVTLLMNNGSIGQSYFDDILVLALDRPAQDD